MGVEAHRVMMTWLMHEVASTADLAAPSWDEFRTAYAATRYFPDQNIVRGMSKQRFTCFSWNTSLPDYSGVIVPNDIDKAKIMVPTTPATCSACIAVPTTARRSLAATPSTPTAGR